MIMNVNLPSPTVTNRPSHELHFGKLLSNSNMGAIFIYFPFPGLSWMGEWKWVPVCLSYNKQSHMRMLKLYACEFKSGGILIKQQLPNVDIEKKYTKDKHIVNKGKNFIEINMYNNK